MAALYLIGYFVVGVVVAKIVYAIVYAMTQDESLDDPAFTTLTTMLWPLWVVFGPIALLILKVGPVVHRWVTGKTGKKGKHE